MAYIVAKTGSFTLTTSRDLRKVRPPEVTAQQLLLRLQTQKGTCFWDSSFGSTLHELPRTKLGPTAERDAEDRVRSALAPMVTSKAIGALTVQVQRAQNRLNLSVCCVDAGGNPIQFSTFVEV